MSKKTAQELQAELDSVIAWFESEDMDIDNAAAKYEQGMKAAEELRQRLEETKNRIIKLRESFSGE